MIKIDFLSGPLAYRQKHTSLRKEALARAIGMSPKQHPVLIDATAGLGRDSFILASLGYEITLLERSSVVFHLLEDALKRASLKIPDIIGRMRLIQADACEWLERREGIDVVYMDPMFPERRKSAAVKKEMKFLQDMVGFQEDDGKLLEIARKCAKKRVVVKRPKLAPPINQMEPSFVIAGSACRFDVYLAG